MPGAHSENSQCDRELQNSALTETTPLGLVPTRTRSFKPFLILFPELRAVLPPTAIGKDFPYNGRWIGVTSSGTGVYLSLAGYFGMTIGWVEGFELNLFGAVVGFDVRRRSCTGD